MFFIDKSGAVTWVLCDDPATVTEFGRQCKVGEITERLVNVSSPNELTSFLPGLKRVLSSGEFEEVSAELRKKIGLTSNGIENLSAGKAGAISDVMEVKRFRSHARRLGSVRVARAKKAAADKKK